MTFRVGGGQDNNWSVCVVSRLPPCVYMYKYVQMCIYMCAGQGITSGVFSDCEMMFTIYLLRHGLLLAWKLLNR